MKWIQSAKAILTDRVLLVIVSLIMAYWVIFPLFPKPTGSNAVSAMTVCAGIFLLYQYSTATIYILFKKERGRGWRAVLGASTVGFGLVAMGLYVLWWNGVEQPSEWISSATSSFGRALLTAGAFTMAISHEAEKIDGRYPSQFWRSVLIALSLVIAFIAGSQFSS